MIDKETTNIGANALLLTNEGKLILQQRDTNPQIMNPGRIAMFGGTIDSSEDIMVGLKRELQEELNINIDNYKVEKLNTYHKTIEKDDINYTVHVYIIFGVKESDLIVNEGKGYICKQPQHFLNNPNLSRITSLAVSDFIKNKL